MLPQHEGALGQSLLFCLFRVSKSLQVLLNGIEAVTVLTLTNSEGPRRVYFGLVGSLFPPELWPPLGVGAFGHPDAPECTQARICTDIHLLRSGRGVITGL